MHLKKRLLDYVIRKLIMNLKKRLLLRNPKKLQRNIFENMKIYKGEERTCVGRKSRWRVAHSFILA